MRKIFNVDNFTYFYDFLPRSIPSHDFSPTQSQYQYRLHRSSGQTQQCSAIETHPYYLDITKLSTVHNHRFLIHPRNKEEKDEKEKEKKKRKKVNWNIKTRTGPSSRFLAKGEHRNFLSPFTLMARVMTFIVLSKSQDVSKDSMRIDGTRKRITLNWGRKIYVFVTFLTRGETR